MKEVMKVQVVPTVIAYRDEIQADLNITESTSAVKEMFKSISVLTLEHEQSIESFNNYFSLLSIVLNTLNYYFFSQNTHNPQAIIRSSYFFFTLCAASSEWF